MMPKTVEILSIVILCFATPTINILQVQLRGSNLNHVNNLKQKSLNRNVRFFTGFRELS